jgi:hypothetical protein
LSPSEEPVYPQPPTQESQLVGWASTAPLQLGQHACWRLFLRDVFLRIRIRANTKTPLARSLADQANQAGVTEVVENGVTVGRPIAHTRTDPDPDVDAPVESTQYCDFFLPRVRALLDASDFVAASNQVDTEGIQVARWHVRSGATHVLLARQSGNS